MKSQRSPARARRTCNTGATKSLLAKLSPAGRRKYFDLMLTENFSAFVMKVFETVSPGDVFRPNWHIDAMTFAAELVINGKIKRLITTVPPRHLKSIIFSVALPAFLLGLDPDQTHHMCKLLQRPRGQARERLSSRHEFSLVSARLSQRKG